MRKLICTIIVFTAGSFASVAHAKLSPAQVVARKAIVRVWGAHGHTARARLGLRIAGCESTWRTWAKNGRHLGLFQMGGPERKKYGHGRGAMTQARAALHYFIDAGTSPWTASEGCWA